MQTKIALGLIVALLSSLMACAAEETSGVDLDAAMEATAPALGKADGGDQADNGCQVVLRSVGRVSNGQGGYETAFPSGPWIWRGEVDVARSIVDAGANVAILYTATTAQGQWFQVPAQPTDDLDSEAFVRYEFAIDDHVPTEGMSGTALSRAQIELIPFVWRGDSRLFDHNRIPDPFVNYELTLDNGWALSDAAGICPGTVDAQHVTRVSVEGGEVSQDGPLVAGGTLVVDYDIEEMTGCLATHNGYPFWDTRAFVRFAPGGQTFDETVREFVSQGGTPTNTVIGVGATFPIPADARAAEIWFRHFSYAGGTVCEQWDSQDGANYTLDVMAPPQWIGNLSLKVSRETNTPCGGAESLDPSDAFVFESWARQRAAITNVCFEVYQDGVTDWVNPDLWRQLDVEVHVRYGDGGPMNVAQVNRVDFSGNNARYAWDLRGLDPFMNGYGGCDTLEEFGFEDGGDLVVPVEYFFTANGLVLAGPDGAPLEGVFRGPTGTCGE